MHKSYKRKNTRNKTRKKYYKVGGGDDDPIIEPIVSQITEITEINTKITNLENSINIILDEIPVFIGYKIIPIGLDPGRSNAYNPNKIPLWVKRNIDSDTFLKIIGNTGSRNRNNNGYGWQTEPYTNINEQVNLIDLKAVYSLPNVRGLPLALVSRNIICYYDDEDRLLFSDLNMTTIRQLQIKYNHLFERPALAELTARFNR